MYRCQPSRIVPKHSICVFAVSLLVILFSVGCQRAGETNGASDSPDSPAPTTKQVGHDEIMKEVGELESAYFADEIEARRFENEWLVPIWDKLNAARIEQRLAVLSQTPFASIEIPQLQNEFDRDLGIHVKQYSGAGPSFDHQQWVARLNELTKQGLGIIHSDWHHSSYWKDESGQPYSEFTFAIHAMILEGLRRFELKGVMEIEWDSSSKIPQAKTIKVTKASLANRSGPPIFEAKMVINAFGNQLDIGKGRADVSAVSVYDLNQDGYPEIILGNGNKIVMNGGDWKTLKAIPLIPVAAAPRSGISSGVGLVSDLTGDGKLDWMNATESGDIRVFPGLAHAKFSTTPILTKLKHKLVEPTCLTCGDIDGDGDLDVFAGQWRKIYEKMPDKYWDANDGHGNTLLLNDGQGRFKDVTDEFGLADKRFRRTYSASFVDLNDDTNLDLLVVSDFSGVEVYINDGSGKFTEQTSETLDNHYCFGMSHTMSDYNNDGAVDILVLGMGSTTARRLEKMGANPVDHETANKMRTIMGYGNRMYLAQGDHKYAAPQYMDSVARTGWAWGSASFDFDNDGDQDIYVTNGHVSGKTTQDYCTNFWCRDINVLPRFEGDEISSYLSNIDKAEQQSWDGYQSNQLLVNDDANGFYNAGFLLDVGFDFDSRRAIAADLDLDGRVDLLVNQIQGTSGVFGSAGQADENGKLIILRNVMPVSGSNPANWIGVILTGAKGTSPIGAKVKIKAGDFKQEAVVITGDSFRAQHPAQKHFGLGNVDSVDEIVVTWPGGKQSRLEKPAVGKYHRVIP